MDLLWQINPWEMLSGLMVTTFLMLLNASIVVVASMVMFPLIDLAFKKKAKPAPAQVEPWHHDGLRTPRAAFRAALVGYEIEVLAARRCTTFPTDELSHRPGARG